MLIVTFPKGMFVRHAVKWLVLEYSLNQRVEIRSGYIRRLPEDLVLSLDGLDCIAAAHDLAKAYGLVLYQCPLKIWRIKKAVWRLADWRPHD